MSDTESLITDWLSSLQPGLKDDIDASRETLVHAAKLFRDAIPTALTETPSTLSLLLARQTPLQKFLHVLEDSPVACNWTPFMEAGQPPLMTKIIFARGWLLETPSSMHCVNARICLAILISISSDEPDFTNMWRKLFNIFKPSTPPKPNPSDQPIRKQTPTAHNSGGLRDTETTHHLVDPVLRRELHLLLYPDTPGFITTYFKRQDLAFENSAALRTTTDGWTGWPDNLDGGNVWAWFKLVADAILPPDATGAYYSSADKILSGSLAVRKTDIVLLYPTNVTKKNPKGIELNKGQFAWKDVLVVGELKPTSKKPGDSIIQLAGYVREIFYAQSNRRFVHAFTLAGDELRTWIFHRGGGVRES